MTNYSLNDLLAIGALVAWPVVPMFWIPVHCVPSFFRRLGLFTYVLPLVTWLPAAVIVFAKRTVLLHYRTDLPGPARIIGIIIFVLGAALQIWTLFLLTLPVITGMPEVTRVQGRIVTSGPFGVVRHPTYLSHTVMLLGIFLASGAWALGAVMAADAFLANAIIIPLEEREMLRRFGREYELYRRKVPSRFVPLCRQG